MGPWKMFRTRRLREMKVARKYEWASFASFGSDDWQD
jgi:hypothetical protein